MDNNSKGKNPAEIFKLFDKWAELLPKEGEELHNEASFSKIGSEIRQHCLNIENQGSGNSNVIADTYANGQRDNTVKEEAAINTEKEDLKPNFLFELKTDKTNASTAPFECVYDFCLTLEKFCKSKSTAENRLDIEEDWKKLLFTCSSHNSERIMWIHLTFQTSNKLKLSWKQVVRRLMANFDDPKRNLSLETALSKFKFLPEVESIYAANLEFARYADELGDDTKRTVHLYLNGMPPTIKEVLQSTIAYDESTHFRYSLLDVQQRAAVFLTANEGDLIFYSKSAHLALALEYEKVDTKNCEFHLLADHSTLDCPDYTVLRFPYMDFTLLQFTAVATKSLQPKESVMSETIVHSRATEKAPEPKNVTEKPASKDVGKSVETGQTKTPTVPPQRPSVPIAVPIKEPDQVRNPVAQQSSSAPAVSANVGHSKDQTPQQQHRTPANPTNPSVASSNPKIQTANAVSIKDPAEKEKYLQTNAVPQKTNQEKATVNAIKQDTVVLAAINVPKQNTVAQTAINATKQNTAAQTVINATKQPTAVQNSATNMPTAQKVATKFSSSPQIPVGHAARTLTMINTTTPQKPNLHVQPFGVNQTNKNIANQPAHMFQNETLPTGPAADRVNNAYAKMPISNAQQLHAQQNGAPKTALLVKKKPPVSTKSQPVKISVPTNNKQALAQQQAPTTHYTLGSSSGYPTNRDLSPPFRMSRSRSHSQSPPRRSYRRERSISPSFSRSRSRSVSPDQHYLRSPSPPRRRRRLSNSSPPRRSESPERGCYIHGAGANHTTKDCRQAQLVIQPRKLNLEPANGRRGLKPSGQPNICIFCGLIFKPGHLGYCKEVLPRKGKLNKRR